MEVVDEATGQAFDTIDELVAGLSRVLQLDRGAVRARAVERFGIDRMVDAYLTLYCGVAGRTGTRP